MPTLVPIRYRAYPPEIRPTIVEVAGHLGRSVIDPSSPYSLHTEYSAGRRDLSSLAQAHPALRDRVRDGIPQLWYDEAWAGAFAAFVVGLVGNHPPPRLIEVHPPFSDYCGSIAQFLDAYAVFERDIRAAFPATRIALENRFGTRYSFPGRPLHGPFLVATAAHLADMARQVGVASRGLGIVLDVPQLLSAHGVTPQTITRAFISDTLAPVRSVRGHIVGIHLWAKKIKSNRYASAHHGNLDDYLGHVPGLKDAFLDELFDLLDDDRPRYFVAETRADADSVAIVNALVARGFVFAPTGSPP